MQEAIDENLFEKPKKRSDATGDFSQKFSLRPNSNIPTLSVPNSSAKKIYLTQIHFFLSKGQNFTKIFSVFLIYEKNTLKFQFHNPEK